jgi:uncharacterized membrane protein YfcA
LCSVGGIASSKLLERERPMFVAAFLAGIFGVGFGFGYAVRSRISHKRRQASKNKWQER